MARRLSGRARRRTALLETLEGRFVLSGLPTLLVPDEPSGGSQSIAVMVDQGIASAGEEANAPPLDGTIEGVTFMESGFIPPDPIGAAGPNHVVSVVNTRIEWHTKAGVEQNSQSLQTFFAPAGAATSTFDPKVIYDQHAGRFVVVTLERTDDNDGSTSGDAADTSKIFVAVSDDSDPNGTWHFLAIDSKTTIGGIDRWADYPGLGLDDEAIYITNNMFGFGSSAGFGGVRLWIVNKTPLYAGGAGTFTVHDPYAGGGVATTTQPAHIYGSAPGNVGTFLVSYSGLSSGGIESVQIVRVDNPITTPTFSQQFVAVGDIDNTAVALPDAPQSGTATEIETNDRRAINAVWRNNSLWTTAEVLPASGADANQVTAHWWQLNTTSLASIAVTQQGNVGGENLATGAFTFFPSIAVDAFGNMAIGFAISDDSMFPSSAYTGRKATDAPGTTQPAAFIAQGLAFYERTFGAGRNRWGDYSGTALDPADERTFWAFNEYALTQASSGSERGRWGTRWGRFVFANDPPVITSSATPSIPENQTLVIDVTATDPESNPLVFSLAGGADAARFSITPGGTLSFSSPPDFEAPTDVGGDNIYNVTVQVTDGLNIVTQDIAVTVTNVNESPTFTTSASLNTPENTTAVATITATDPESSPLVFSLVGGADMAKFSLTPGGVLTLNASPDFEAPTDIGGDNVYDIRVSVSDGTSSTTQDIAVTVTDVNETPSFTSSSALNTPENITPVTTITANDPESNPLLFSLVGGADQSKFSITTGGALSFLVAPNFEAPTDVGGDNVYDVRVQVTDGTFLVTQDIAVTVTNINEPPNVALTGEIALLPENTSTPTKVADISVTDDAPASTTITLSGADAAFFVVVGTELRVKGMTVLNFEAKSSYAVTVNVDDPTIGAGPDASVNYTLTLTNEPEPGAVSASGSAFQGQTLTANVIDGDGTTTSSPVYQWQRRPPVTGAPWQTISGATGSTYVLTQADTSHRVRVRVTYTDDRGDAENRISLPTPLVANVNDAPQGADNTVTTIEDTQYTFASSDFALIDPIDAPANSLQKVKITTLPAAGTLTLNGAAVAAGDFVSEADIAAGRFKYAPPLNAEGAAVATFGFQVQDDGGTSNGGVDLDPSPNVLAINATPVNDAPTLNKAASPTLPAIPEDTVNPAGASIESLLGIAVADPDAGAVRGIAVTLVTNTTQGTWQYSLNDGSTWLLLPAVNVSNALLLAADGQTRVRFKPNTNFNGTSHIVFHAWDQSQGSAGGTANLSTAGSTGGDTPFSAVTDYASIRVNPVNDAPVLDAALVRTLPSIDEDTANPAGGLVAALTNGAVSDVDAGALQGIAVTGLSHATRGTWQYSLNGTLWLPFESVSASSARLLLSNGEMKVRFIPNADFHGQVRITYRAWDRTQGAPGGTFDLTAPGATGGTSAFSTAVEQATLTINSVNDAPVLDDISGTIGYVANTTPAIRPASTATVADVDGDLDGGELRVHIGLGADASNRLAIGGPFAVNTTTGEVSLNGTVIGTRNAGGGVGTTDLVVTLNANATASIAQQLVRAISFRTVGGVAGQRRLLFSLSDGDGATSAVRTKTVVVS